MPRAERCGWWVLLAMSLPNTVVSAQDPPVRIALLLEQLGPGEFRIGLLIQPDSGWYIYWSNPGEVGLPTVPQLRLPAGWAHDEWQWPTPRSLQVGHLTSFVYDSSAVLLTVIRASASHDRASVRIEAKVSLGVCRRICIPAKLHASLELPAPSHGSSAAALIRAAAKRIPIPLAAHPTRPNAPPRRLQGMPPGTSVEFFPLRQGDMWGHRAMTWAWEGDAIRVALPVSDDGRTLRGVLSARGHAAAQAYLIAGSDQTASAP